MQHSSWTIKTFENGETTVRSGLDHQQAVEAIERMMRGQDPLADTAVHKTVRLRTRGEHVPQRARVAA
ncbi:MAG: hypothetical protein R2725_09830 [Solirubrobacterales bacterium]